MSLSNTMLRIWAVRGGLGDPLSVDLVFGEKLVYKGVWGLWGGGYSLMDKIRKVLFYQAHLVKALDARWCPFCENVIFKGKLTISNKICIESYKGGRKRSVFDQSTVLRNSESSVINCSTNFYEIEFIKSFKNVYSGFWSSWVEALPGAKGLRTQALLLMFN